jgi:hypothetical protein
MFGSSLCPPKCFLGVCLSQTHADGLNSRTQSNHGDVPKCHGSSTACPIRAGSASLIEHLSGPPSSLHFDKWRLLPEFVALMQNISAAAS